MYLCALVNNCVRCTTLWETTLQSCTAGGGQELPALSDISRQSLHVGYVIDGFGNLSNAAMQMASHQAQLGSTLHSA